MPVQGLAYAYEEDVRETRALHTQVLLRRPAGHRPSADAQTVRLAVERISEMEKFWRFITRSRGSLKPGSIEAP
jgi:hypothetical protein